MAKFSFPTEKELENLSRFILRKKDKDKALLRKKALEWLTAAWRNKLDYEVNWLGIPIIQNPYDMVRMQELIFRLRPDFIVETGIAHGGSLVYYASLMELLGHGRVVGIDNDIRSHNRRLLEKHPLSKRFTMLEASSVDPKTVAQVKKIIGAGKKVMVLLDSHHTHDHVLKELELYSPLVSKGSHCVVFDTTLEYFPKNYFLDRPWGRGNNPKTAVDNFLHKNKNFVIDTDIEDKFFVTIAAGGYLKRIR